MMMMMSSSVAASRSSSAALLWWRRLLLLLVAVFFAPNTTNTLLFATAAISSSSNASPDNYMTVNPIQVRIDPFRVQVGPTNTQTSTTLSLADAEIILGIVEDLVTDYARFHFKDIDDTEFKYAILALVELSSSSQRTTTTTTAAAAKTTTMSSESTTTTLYFSGGLGYFGGKSAVVPSQPELALLVNLALNDYDLTVAVAEKYPFISMAKYIPGQYDDDEDNNNGEEEEQTTTNSGSNDGETPSDNNDASDHSGSSSSSSAASSALHNDNILQPEDGDGGDTNDQFIIVVASACGAGLVFCALVAALALIRHQRRKAFWRDDNAALQTKGALATTTTCTSAGNGKADDEDAALEDLEGSCYHHNKKRGKKQSLHLRDSLRESHQQQEQPQDTLSDTGSYRLGRLLSTAAAATVSVLSLPCADGDTTKDVERPGLGDHRGSHDTTDSSSADASIHHSNKDAPDSADDLTYLSDFEGNAVIKPNLVPVTDLDHYDNLHAPIPPSRTPFARRDERPIISPTAITQTFLSDPTTKTETAATGIRPKPSQESFMSKYIHPITGNILPIGSVSFPSYSYFGSGGDNDMQNNDKTKGEISPRTTSTAAEEMVIDARWSDVSSDLGNKTDDDFAVDKAWDPDDASVNSNEKDFFALPMTSPSSRRLSCINDEVQLLKMAEPPHTYNLDKLHVVRQQDAPTSTRTIIEVEDTTAI